MVNNSTFSNLSNLLIAASRDANRMTLRDYYEIEQLQNSHAGTEKFALRTLDRVQKKLIANLEYNCKNFELIGYNDYLKQNENLVNNHIIYQPIDGINNFVHAIPYFSTFLIVRQKDANNNFTTTHIIIDCPGLKMLYILEQNGGAWCENYYDNNRRSYRLRVSSRNQNNFLIGNNENIALSGENIINYNLHNLSIAYAFFSAGKFDAIVTNKEINTSIFSLCYKNTGGKLDVIKDNLYLLNNTQKKLINAIDNAT
jgi:fructose-1,6-bisphosphatase/inositol monophosphatase family enzyme